MAFGHRFFWMLMEEKVVKIAADDFTGSVMWFSNGRWQQFSKLCTHQQKSQNIKNFFQDHQKQGWLKITIINSLEWEYFQGFSGAKRFPVKQKLIDLALVQTLFLNLSTEVTSSSSWVDEKLSCLWDESLIFLLWVFSGFSSGGWMDDKVIKICIWRCKKEHRLSQTYVPRQTVGFWFVSMPGSIGSEEEKTLHWIFKFTSSNSISACLFNSSMKWHVWVPGASPPIWLKKFAT